MFAGVAIPPVLEDHLEPGFCSADCPVQHAGHGAAIAPPARPSAARGSRADGLRRGAGPRMPISFRSRRPTRPAHRPPRSAAVRSVP